MTTPNAARPSARRRVVSAIDRFLAAFGLIRVSRAKRLAASTKPGRNPRQTAEIIRLKGQRDRAVRRLTKAEHRLALMRFGYGRVLLALGVYQGDPETIEVPRRAEVHAIVKSIARVLGSRRISAAASKFQPASVSMLDSIRALVGAGSATEARGFAHEILQSSEMVGTYGSGIASIRMLQWDDAYRKLSAFGRSNALQFVPDEYLQAAAHEDPTEAIAAARELIEDGGHIAAHTLDANRWIRLAERLVMLREPELVSGALDLAEKAGAEGLEDQVAFTREWLAIEADSNAAPDDAISIGIVDYKQPSFATSSSNLGDHVQTLASMGHLVRHANLSFTGESDLVKLADTLAARVKPERAITDSAAAKVNLTLVQRDASDLQTLPKNTWMVTFGWYAHLRPNDTYGMPLNENIRPIFISVHVNRIAMLTPEAIAYLRKYAPIGCRDWNTVHLLHAAGIPAFFSGCITTTVDTVFPGEPGARGGGDLYVDTKPTGPGDTWRQVRPEVRTDPFAVNMNNAIAKLTQYRDSYDTVYTSRLHCFLPARSIGADVHFIARNESDPRFDGLIGIDDIAYEKVRQGILGKVEQVMRLIVAGTPEEEVYKHWAEICAEDVAYAQQVRDEITSTPIEQQIDIDAAVASARALSKFYPRTVEGEGEEVHVELSLDGNFRTQMLVMVESILERTKRPVHFWVLAREHGEADYERVAKLYPQASFTWIPCDEIDYGQIHGMISHTTIATMDRLLLPLLLPDVAKAIHMDLDAICLGDIGELYDIDVTDYPLAARTRQDGTIRGAFEVLRGTAKGLPADLSREFVARTHSRHKFDFDAFNAGVMLLNLERMRKDDFCREFLPYAGRFGIHDQDVLNAYTGADRRHFGAEWNTIARDELVDEAKVIHWAGSLKPWGSTPVRGQSIWTDARDTVLERLGSDEERKAVAATRP